VPLDHFTYGWLTPTLSYTLSVLGSLLGLLCTVRARAMRDKARRARWLLLAAWAIGGTGIWVMHFMAMIGFSIPGLPVRYDIPITIASWLTAIVVVAIGLFIVGYGKPNAGKILLGGVFMGVGVAAMHYTGMAAMRTTADVSYDRELVIASVVIAIVASTVALWFTVTLKKGLALTVAALIMGVAVNGMHFTGMYALRITNVHPTTVNGILPIAFLAPIVLFVVAVIVVLMVALLNRAGTDGGDGTLVAPPAPVPMPAIPGQRTAPTSAPSGMGSAFGARAKR
jgi:NO-binding membrane sensor protein with MHYT domain